MRALSSIVGISNQMVTAMRRFNGQQTCPDDLKLSGWNQE